MTKTDFGVGVGAELKEKISFRGARIGLDLTDRDPDPSVKSISIALDLGFLPRHLIFARGRQDRLEWEELVKFLSPGGFVFRRGEGGTPAVP